MPIEEEWTAFEYGTMDAVLNVNGQQVPGRTVVVHDPVSKRVIKLKMTVEEAKAFGKVCVDGMPGAGAPSGIVIPHLNADALRGQG